MISRLPALLSIYFQCLLIAGDVTHHRVAVDTCEYSGRGAERQATKRTMLYLKDEGGRRLATGVGDGGDAAKLWKIAQVLE